MESKKVIFDGEGVILGRLGTAAAKELLKGNYVDIINCEKVIVSGDKDRLVNEIRRKQKMGRGGSLKGPRYPIVSDKLSKRMIRGMLPWDRAKGREAYKRLKCYVGDRKIDASKGKIIKLEKKKVEKSTTIKEAVRALK
jgi:large subunit ribosomal protein L13